MTTPPAPGITRTPRIAADRLLADLESLAMIGGRPDGGVDRVAGSAADQEARRWLVARLQEAGLEGWSDEHGNVLGRAAGHTGPWLLVGSHTDTVPAGGRLDGAYGVIAALEVLRTLKDAGDPLAGRVEIVSFHNEEGVSGPGLVGSSALIASEHVDHLIGYLELHIEQGPRLEAEGLELGLVEGIVGIERWEARVKGQANHAGTTPMAMRRDAGRVAARFIAGLKELLDSVDPEMVGNVGQVTFLPGVANVIPGEAQFTVELRSADPASLAGAVRAMRMRLEQIALIEGCSAELERTAGHPPTPMNQSVLAALEHACAATGRRWRRMVSGAGHDALTLAQAVPAGMLFVPSSGGISHSPEEHTDDRLLLAGAQVLLDAVVDTSAVLEEEDRSFIERLNSLDSEGAEARLRTCCGSQRWAAEVAAGRPYATRAALYRAAERAWWSLEESDWREAFTAHPRIGDRDIADPGARREQAAAAHASAGTLTALADANRRYEERFGHVFLIFASGKSADEMLTALNLRLYNDAEAELRIAAGEQARITRLRLERLLL